MTTGTSTGHLAYAEAEIDEVFDRLDGFVPNETDQRDRFVNHYNFVDNPC